MTQASISAIYQDSSGFIWLGSQNGVDRFDGQEFQSFELNKLQEAPTIRYTTAITEDDQGNIWVGTEKGGLWRYNPRKGDIKVFLGGNSATAVLDSDEIRSISSNSTGKLHVLTGTGNIFRITTGVDGNSEFHQVTPSTENVGRNYLKLEIDDQDNLIAISLDGSFERLGPSEEKYYSRLSQFGGIAGSSKAFMIWSSFISSQQKLVLGGNDGALMIHDLERESGKLFEIEYEGKSVGRIHDVTEDHEGQIIIGTDNGVYFVDEENGEILRVRKTGLRGKSCEVIQSLIVGESNKLWAGSLGCGFYEQKSDPIFNVYRNEEGNSNSLSGNGIWTLAEDELGGIWIATVGNGISRFDPQTGSFDQYRQEGHYQIDSDNTVDLMIDSKKKLWLSTFKGVSIIDLVIENDKVVLGSVVERMKFPSHAWQFLELRNGQVVIGTGSSGVFLYDRELKSHSSLIDYSSLPPSAISSGVQGLHEDLDGNIWLGTFGYGLMKFNPATKSLTSYIDRKDELPFGTVVTTISAGSEDGEMWIGSYDGLISFDSKTEEYKNFNRANSQIPDEIVYTIVKDDYPNYWITSNKGVSLFNEEEERFTNFTMADGLQDMEFNIQAGTKGRDGVIYLGGINGFNTINHDDLKLDQIPSDLMFTGLRIMNKQVMTSNEGHIESLLPYSDEIVLNPEDVFFEVTFATKGLNDREKYNFQYKLDGLDDLWLDNGNKKTVTYTNLDPGNYTLMVRSSIREAAWGPPSEIRIKVLPAWYKSWWAKIVWTLLTLAVLWSVLQLLLQKEKRGIHQNELDRKQQELKREKEANVRLRELDKLKSVFLANMSHEIRTPLTSIIGFADYLSETLPEEHVEYANYILNGGNRLMETINSVLDLAQLEGRAMKLYLANLDLVEMVPIYLSVFNTMKSSKEIVSVEFENLSSESLWVNVDQGALQRIVVNLVGNARKFTPVDGSIKVILEKSESSALIKVIDTGIGIDEEYIPNIFNMFSQESAGTSRTHEGNGLGLAITKQLVEMMEGTISVASRKGEGSTFTVTLPLTSQEASLPSD